jgi:hypothetical protein
LAYAPDILKDYLKESPEKLKNIYEDVRKMNNKLSISP